MNYTHFTRKVDSVTKEYEDTIDHISNGTTFYDGFKREMEETYDIFKKVTDSVGEKYRQVEKIQMDIHSLQDEAVTFIRSTEESQESAKHLQEAIQHMRKVISENKAKQLQYEEEVGQ